jgi:hypothetical protein
MSRSGENGELAKRLMRSQVPLPARRTLPPELQDMLPVPSAADMLEFELVRYVWGKFVQKSPGLALETLKWMVRHQSPVDEQAVESVYRKTELYQGHQDLYRYMGELTILELRRATVLALMLLNLHLRDLLESEDMNPLSPTWADQHLSKLFDGNKLMKAFCEVTTGDTFEEDAAMARTRKEHIPLDGVRLPYRRGIWQCMRAASTGIAATVSNNVWMHYHKRIERHVNWVWKMPHGE